MITLKRNGRIYEITEMDQERIRELAIANGGDIRKAMADQWQEKFGEPLDLKQQIVTE